MQMKIGATSTKDIHLVSLAHVPETDTALPTFAENLSERLGTPASAIVGSVDDLSEEKLSRRNGMGGSLLGREENTSTQKAIVIGEPLSVEPSPESIQRTLASQTKQIALQVQLQDPEGIVQESDSTKELIGEKGLASDEVDSKAKPAIVEWNMVETDNQNLEVSTPSGDEITRLGSKENAPIKDRPAQNVFVLTETGTAVVAKDAKPSDPTKTSSSDPKNVRLKKDAKEKDSVSNSIDSAVLLPIPAESIVSVPVSISVAVPVPVKPQDTKTEQFLSTSTVTARASGPVALRNADSAKSVHAAAIAKKDVGAEAPPSTSKDVQVPAADPVNKIVAGKDPGGSHPQEKDAVALAMMGPHGATVPSQGTSVQEGHGGTKDLSATHPVPSTATPRAEGSSLAVPDRERTLLATPTSIEVGIPGGSHGWLKLRAEMTADGSIQASMSPSSLSHADELRRELPSLTTYLHQEQIPVSSVAIHEPARTHSVSDTPGGMNLNSGTGGEARDSQNGEKRMQEFSRDEPIRFLAETDEERTDWPLLSGGRGRGWLSVRA